MNSYRITASALFIVLGLGGCGNPSNDRAVTMEELESVQEEDQKQMEAYAPKRDYLSAVELINLADCDGLPCIQLFMKDLSSDFVHATKGEFASLHRSVVVDTTGAELVMPLSTYYVDVSPQATWRTAHTLHTKALGDSLYDEFMQLGFTFVEEGYYLGLKSKQQRYVSSKYPGKSLYITATYRPWYFKGLYKGSVSWPCYVFEVYNDQ